MNKHKIITFLPTLLILLSAFFWGSALVYQRYILNSGFESHNIVSIKLFFGLITLFIFILYKNRLMFKIDTRGLIVCLIMGVFCQALYNLLMMISIYLTNVSTYVALLYTSPVIVAILSKIVFKEKMNVFKVFAIIASVIGVFITVTNGNTNELQLNKIGIVLGLISGFLFSLTTIISKAYVSKYETVSILFYTFLFGFLFSLLFSNPLTFFQSEYSVKVKLFLLASGVLSTGLAYILYLKGLDLGVMPARASVLSTLEVPVSVIGEMIVFNDDISLVKLSGIFLVIIASLIINYKIRE